MESSVAALAGSTLDRPYLTRRELLALGYDDRDIRAAVRSGAWVRCRVGVFVPRAAWDAMDARARHLLVARAVLERFGERVALSHVSAVVAHGVVPDGVPLDAVHVLRLDGGSGRRESGVVHHEAPRGVALPLTSVDGMRTVSIAVAARQVATRTDQKRTLGLLDALFNAEVLDDAALDEVDDLAERWPGTARFRLVRPFADRRVASFGESYVRSLCLTFRLPMPDLQRPFRDEHGEVWAFTDFDWLDGRHLGEFDGRIKYTRYLREGETVSDAVERERRRENRLRATGAGMTRFVWDDVLDRNAAATAARLAADLEQSRRLYLGPR